MASRYLFPADRSTYVYGAPGAPITTPFSTALTVYLDQACTQLADILATDGTPISNSIIHTLDSGLCQEFLGPLGVIRLWVKSVAGPAVAVDANYGSQIAQLALANTHTVLHGTTPPTDAVGEVDDFYLDVAAVRIYGPKTLSGWGAGVSLVGQQGLTGAAGVGLPSFTHGGLLVPLTSPTGRIPNDTGRTLTLTRLRASVDVAPVGGPVTVHFLLDGLQVGTVDVPAGYLTAFADVQVPWPDQSFLSVTVPVVGTTYPGDTLTVSANAG